MATLVKQHGRYYLQFYHGDRSPQNKRVALKTTRKRPAQAKQRELEDAYVEGRFDPWTDDPFTYEQQGVDPQTIGAALRRFIHRKRERGRSKHTIRTYQEVVGLFAGTVGDGRMLDAITADQLRDFIRDDAIADATQLKRYGHLRAFFRWSKDEGFMRSYPLSDVEKPSASDKLPKAISAGELEALCDALRADYETKREKNWIREGQMVWRIPLFWFAFYTGMRRSELARLRWEHIDFERGLIFIYEQKNGREQTIPLHDKARDVLEGLERGAGDDYVFTSPTFDSKERSERNFGERASEAFREARKAAELRDGLSFHSLRHGTATALAEAGKSATVIKEYMRHSEFETSMRYIHLANEHLKNEVAGAF
jgi:integrase